MASSLLYVLHSNGLVDGVRTDPNRFREVFASKYGKVRIYKILSVSKESKDWVEENHVCDAEGSWFCPGQYPPALKVVLEQKSDFAQLEDFNRGSGADDEYTKEYFENLNNAGGSKAAPGNPNAKPGGDKTEKQIQILRQDQIDQVNEKWENNEATTLLWRMVSNNQPAEFVELIKENPAVPHVRSEDGRGPMWWAHEYGRTQIISMLKKLGVSENLKDANGITPLDISKNKKS
jgi:dolichyl-diphosphooligosaccharide--protein glycosyltransferase